MTLEKVKQVLVGVEGWLIPKEVDFLYEQARRLKNKGVIVEIGSYKGRSTITLAGGSEEGLSNKIYAIDPHITDLEQRLSNKSESSFNDFKKNIEDSGLAYLVEPIISLSQDVVKNWNKPIEFLWIDGDHTYEGAKRDFDLFVPFLVDGGVVAFHDSYSVVVQKVLKDCIFTSKYYSDTGIAGTIAFGKKHNKPVFLIERIKNRYVFILIKLRRILYDVPLPQGIKQIISNFGKILLRIAGLDRAHV